MTEVLTKNIEACEPSVRCLLEILRKIENLAELVNQLDIVIAQLQDFINYFVHIGFPNN